MNTTTSTSYTIETYIDPNSKNQGVLFSVTLNGKKVYERDYGSQIESLLTMVMDYVSHNNPEIPW